jgi:penicillin-binding protein 1A
VKLARFFVAFVLIVAVGGAALAGCLALLIPAGAVFSKSVEVDALLPAMDSPAERSYVLDRRGGLMTTLFAEEDRQPIVLADVPPHLIDAVLAIEDRRFYEHDGIDWNGTARALVENLDSGEIEQGGSTITQQLVKNTMSDTERRDLKTKVREAVLAYRLEQEMEKDEILERYLNVIYLGNGAYGVKAAAERYFDKRDLLQLTIGESALLAGLIQAPEALNPVTHPDRAARRRALVLESMVETGAITEDEATLARQEPLPTTAKSPDRRRDHFTEAVLQQLLDDDPAVAGDVAEWLGPTQSARYNAVFRGGLRIYTTYDPAVQWLAASAVANTLPDTEFTAAIVVIDNADGSVRGMYTGQEFAQEQFNPVTQKGRPTGSTFKAITLATALEAGYSSDDRVSGSTISVDRPEGAWRTECRGGTLTFADAIADSNNCAFIRTLLSLGPGHQGEDGALPIIQMANRLGIDASKLDGVPSMTLGTSDTNVLDMAEAFSVFANDGIHRTPRYISRVEDADGKLIYEAKPTDIRAMSENNARTETQMLTGVIKDGTGTRARLDRPAAGKTGTNTDNYDAWFVGYTPQYTAAVWMGHPASAIAMNNVGGVRVQGGNYPAQIWAAFMKPAHENLPVIDFTPPDEEQWPKPGRITEEGRKEGLGAPASGSNVPTSVPTDATAPDPNAPTVPPDPAAPAPAQ